MKKILILGGNPTECVVIKHAQALGYYTIVTDNHSNWNFSPGKLIADEGWDISWNEIDLLVDKCRKEQVKGVIAGFSEFRVESMIKLCSKLNLPCWLTLEQLDITKDKLQFKKLCTQYNIPCVHGYNYDSVEKFPVIVKPVDRAGSIGINVAYNKKELDKYYEYALSLSPSRQVVIEDFIADGIKFDVFYFVQDGKVFLLGTSDTIMCECKKGAETLQKAWTYPSVYENRYVNQVDKLVKEMLIGIGLKDGYATMSAFYREDDFYFFETGFRLSGEMSFDYYKAISGIDYLDVLIRYSMGDIGEKDKIHEISSARGYMVTINYYGLNGVVHSIDNVSKIRSIKEVCSFLLYVKEGDSIDNKSIVLQKIAMCSVFSTDFEKILGVVQNINSMFDVKTDKANSLIYERITLAEILKK